MPVYYKMINTAAARLVSARLDFSTSPGHTEWFLLFKRRDLCRLYTASWTEKFLHWCFKSEQMWTTLSWCVRRVCVKIEKEMKKKGHDCVSMCLSVGISSSVSMCLCRLKPQWRRRDMTVCLCVCLLVSPVVCLCVCVDWGLNEEEGTWLCVYVTVCWYLQ